MKDRMTEMEAMLDAQLKGLSLEQAQQAVETQGSFNLAQEAMKAEKIGEGESKPKPKPAAEDEDLDAALDTILG
jgi:hypothetical protein